MRLNTLLLFASRIVNDSDTVPSAWLVDCSLLLQESTIVFELQLLGASPTAVWLTGDLKFGMLHVVLVLCSVRHCPGCTGCYTDVNLMDLSPSSAHCYINVYLMLQQHMLFQATCVIDAASMCFG